MRHLKNIIIAIMFIFFQPLLAEEVDEITFSGGIPLEGYQPSLIIPILTEAFKRNGIKFNIEYHPNLRSLELSNSGKADGELHRVYEFQDVSGGKYANLIRIESKMLSVWVSAYATKDMSINSWSDLADKHVVYQRGRKNIESAFNLISPAKVSLARTDEQAFRMLSFGRADIVISERRHGKNILNGNMIFSKVKEVSALEEVQIFSYIHKKHKKLALKLAKTLDEMKQDGTFLKIAREIDNNFK